MDAALVDVILSRLEGETLKKALIRACCFDRLVEPFPRHLAIELVDPAGGRANRKFLSRAIWALRTTGDLEQTMRLAEMTLQGSRITGPALVMTTGMVVICSDEDRRQSQQSDEAFQRALRGDWDGALSLAARIPDGRFREQALQHVARCGTEAARLDFAERAALLLQDREQTLRSLCDIARAAPDLLASHRAPPLPSKCWHAPTPTCAFFNPDALRACSNTGRSRSQLKRVMT